MRLPTGRMTREQRRAALMSILAHKGVTVERHEQHDERLEENRLARWYGYQNDDIAAARDTFTDKD